MSVEILAAAADRMPGSSTLRPDSIKHPIRADEELHWATHPVNASTRPPAVTVAPAPTSG